MWEVPNRTKREFSLLVSPDIVTMSSTYRETQISCATEVVLKNTVWQSNHDGWTSILNLLWRQEVPEAKAEHAKKVRQVHHPVGSPHSDLTHVQNLSGHAIGLSAGP